MLQKRVKICHLSASVADMQGGDNESATVSSLITSDLKSLLQMWQIFTKIM